MKNAFIFVLGAAVGGTAAFFGTKKYFENKADAEIAEVEEYYRDKNNDIELREQELNKAEEKIAADKVDNTINDVKTAYTKYSNSDAPREVKDESDKKDPLKPFAVSDDEFGVFPEDGWETETFTFYAKDGTLSDEQDIEMSEEDIIEHVGADFQSHIGEYDSDVAYIRNPKYKRDYEILVVDDTYDEVIQ